MRNRCTRIWHIKNYYPLKNLLKRKRRIVKRVRKKNKRKYWLKRNLLRRSQLMTMQSILEASDKIQVSQMKKKR